MTKIVFEAMARAHARTPGLFPERPSVKCFIAWMRDIGHGGEQLLTRIYVDYCETMEVMGQESVSLKRFRRALRSAGHEPYQADWRKNDGTRFRPQVVNLSVSKPELAVFQRQMAEIKTLPTRNSKSATSAKCDFGIAA